MTTISAWRIRKNDVVTYCGETFQVKKAEVDATTGLIKITPKGGGVAQYIADFREVEVVRSVLVHAVTPDRLGGFNVAFGSRNLSYYVAAHEVEAWEETKRGKGWKVGARLHKGRQA